MNCGILTIYLIEFLSIDSNMGYIVFLSKMLSPDNLYVLRKVLEMILESNKSCYEYN